MSDEVQALDVFFLNFPREIAWKGILKDGKQFFTRNRYAKNASELYEKLKDIQVDFFASVYGFEGEYKTGVMWDRSKAVINRLFFDFDCKESPATALKEVKRFINALSAKPIVVFSGAKGFHVHIVFRRTNVTPNTIKRFGVFAIETLKLKTCDPQVFEIARLCRVPFSIHSATDAKCTIIDANRILKMTFDDVLRFAKTKWDFPEFELDDETRTMIERIEIMEKEELERRKECTELIYVHGDKIVSGSEVGRKNRIALYVSTLKKHGYLSANPKIREIHIKNKWVAQNTTAGAIEHIARVYLVLMLIEEGYSDEQIHSILKYARDYDPQRTQYYINYNREWLKRRSLAV